MVSSVHLHRFTNHKHITKLTQQECRVDRRYGLQSTVAYTLLDPASFFSNDGAAASQRAAPGQPPDLNLTVTVSSGPSEASNNKQSAAAASGGSKLPAAGAAAPAVAAADNKLPAAAARGSSGKRRGGGAPSGRIGSRAAAGRARLADWLEGRSGAAAGGLPLAAEFRQRLAAELRRASVQVALEYDRPSM